MPDARLEPMSLGEILNTAIRICRGRFAALTRLVAVFVVPVEILGGIVRALGPHTSTGASQYTTGTIGVILEDLFVSVVLVSLANQLATAAGLKVVSDTYLGHPTAWRAAVGFVSGKLGPIIALALLTTGLELAAASPLVVFALLGSGGAIVLVLPLAAPVIYLAISWIVAMPVLLLEGARNAAALRRARLLVSGRWWQTLGVYLTGLIFTLLANLILSTIIFGLFRASSSSWYEQVALQTVGATVSVVLTTPFLSAVIALIYYDLRIRKEGLDSETLALAVQLDADSR